MPSPTRWSRASSGSWTSPRSPARSSPRWDPPTPGCSPTTTTGASRWRRPGKTTGELGWRLPFHPEYSELIKGKYADLDNAPEGRKASSITAADFLRNFVGDVPWVHMDIAGTAWDQGRPYVGKGASGYGVRTLVELARRAAA